MIEKNILPYLEKIVQFGSDYSNCQFFYKGENQVFQVTFLTNSLDPSQEHSIEEITPEFWQWPLLMPMEEGTGLVVSECKASEAFIEGGEPVKAALDDMAQIIGEEAQIAEYRAEKIGQALSKSSGCLIDAREEGLGCLMATTGRNLFEAFVARTVLEKSVFVNEKAKSIGGVTYLDSRESKKMRSFYLDSYSKPELEHFEEKPEEVLQVEFDDEELALREKIIEIGHRLLELNLVQGTWGNISARLNDEFVLCTPSGIDYKSLEPADISKVYLETGEYSGRKKPTSEKELHLAIYRSRPEVNACVHTHSTYCSIFAAARMPLQLFDEAEIAKAGALFHVADYALPGTDDLAEKTNEALGRRKGALMANHGMIGCEVDLDKALEVCMSMEKGAKVFIDNRTK